MAKKSFVEVVGEHLEEGRTDLPIFDRTSLKLQEMIQDGTFDIGQVERLIACDPALTSGLLRMSNSTFYGGLEKVVTVRDAIVRLGIKQVANLVILGSQKKNFQLRDRNLARVAKGLWRHSVGCAIGTQWLARRLELVEVQDHAFLSGLLHDIGKLFLLRVVDDLVQSKRYRFEPTEALVLDPLTSMHSEQGSRLMTSWNIPDVYVEVVRSHHREDWDEKNRLVTATRLVDLTCNKLGIGLSGAVPVELPTTREARCLHCDEMTLAELEIKLEDAMNLTT